MSATTSSTTFSGNRQARPSPVDPVVHRRRITAAVLTAIALAIGAVLLATDGRDLIFVYLLPLPVALLLLWTSTTADRFDDRGIERLAGDDADVRERPTSPEPRFDRP